VSWVDGKTLRIEVKVCETRREADVTVLNTGNVYNRVFIGFIPRLAIFQGYVFKALKVVNNFRTGKLQGIILLKRFAGMYC